MECCSKFRDCFLREWFQLKKLMLLRFPSFQNDSLKRFVSLSTSPSRRKFLLRRRERLFVIIRNIFVCSIFHHTARRLKHRCTEKKKKKEGKKSFSILRIWWTFQERSNGRATLHEGRDDLQLVNLCVPPRSTIVVSKFNSRDSIAFNKHQKWTSIRTTKRKSRGGKKKNNKNNDGRLHTQESLFRTLFIKTLLFALFFNHLRFFLRLHLDARGEGVVTRLDSRRLAKRTAK